MISTVSSPITLKGGLTVSLETLRLLWAFEDRGCTVKVEAGALLIGPRSRITDEEREQIREHRDELLAVVNYVATLEEM